MKVRFLKKHVQWNKDDEVDIPDSMAAYMLLCGVAEPTETDHDKAESILLKHLEENSKK